jgi:cell shape-determining protein MreC
MRSAAAEELQGLNEAVEEVEEDAEAIAKQVNKTIAQQANQAITKPGQKAEEEQDAFQLVEEEEEDNQRIITLCSTENSKKNAHLQGTQVHNRNPSPSQAPQVQ